MVATRKQSKTPEVARSGRGVRRRRRRNGTAIAETAIIMPTMIIITFMMIQYGLVLNFRVSIESLARQGARYAAVAPDSDVDIMEYIHERIPAPLNSSNLSIEVSPDEGSALRTRKQPITVTLTYDPTEHMFLGSEFFGIPLPATDIKAEAVMMIE